MKFGFPRNFAVRVRNQKEDEDSATAHFYDGIYSVALNFLLPIDFIPEFQRETKRWYLEGPNDVDNIESVQEARLVTAALSEYVVTEDIYHAGQEELIPLTIPPSLSNVRPEVGIIFYVTPEKFALFSQELAQIAEKTSSVYDYFPVSQLTDFEVIQFILHQVISSTHFSEKSLKIIGRAEKTVHQARAYQTCADAGSNGATGLEISENRVLVEHGLMRV
jgi:hypothetical protein